MRGGRAPARAAPAVGRDASARCRRDGVTTKSTPTDVVTASDHARGDARSASGSAALRPGDAVVGEEQGGGAGRERGAGRHRWVVDPIDGTVNFLYGHALVRGVARGGARRACRWPGR